MNFEHTRGVASRLATSAAHHFPSTLHPQTTEADYLLRQRTATYPLACPVTRTFVSVRRSTRAGCRVTLELSEVKLQFFVHVPTRTAAE